MFNFLSSLIMHDFEHLKDTDHIKLVEQMVEWDIVNTKALIAYLGKT